MIKVIIVEDEISGQELLKNYIERFFPTLTVLHIADNVANAIQSIEDLAPDLVFLDVQIKGGFGTDILNHFPEKSFSTIFITAHSDYTLDAFKHEATDYLLKPINAAEFQKRVERAIQKIGIKQPSKTKTNSIKISVTSAGGQFYIDSSSIIYLKADGAYTHIHTEQERYTSSKNLGDFEKELTTFDFFRPHNSFLVNSMYISQIEKSRTGIIYLNNGEKLPISQRRISAFLQHIKKF